MQTRILCSENPERMQNLGNSGCGLEFLHNLTSPPAANGGSDSIYLVESGGGPSVSERMTEIYLEESVSFSIHLKRVGGVHKNLAMC